MNYGVYDKMENMKQVLTSRLNLCPILFNSIVLFSFNALYVEHVAFIKKNVKRPAQDII